jgi:hypothetical protein
MGRTPGRVVRVADPVARFAADSWAKLRQRRAVIVILLAIVGALRARGRVASTSLRS